MIPIDPNGSSAVSISSDEGRILNALTKQDSRMEVILPPSASADELWRTLEICVKGVNYMTGRVYRLKPIIGRIMVRFENKPSLYKELGYQTFHDFKFKGVADTLGLCRSSVYEALALARDWKQITPERYEKIGPKRMNILNAFAKGTASNAEALLQKAESMSVSELRHWAEDSGEVAPGETIPKTIEIHTTLDIYRMWVDFRKSEDIQAYLGTADPGRILQSLMQECHNEWLVKGASKIADRKEKEHDPVRNIDIREGDAAQVGGEDSQADSQGNANTGG